MKKALLYLSVTAAAFLAFYLFYLLSCHVIDPLLRKTGLQFDKSGFSSWGNIGDFIMVLIYIRLFGSISKPPIKYIER